MSVFLKNANVSLFGVFFVVEISARTPIFIITVSDYY